MVRAITRNFSNDALGLGCPIMKVTEPKTRTAKGLFRATGKHSKQVACLGLDGNITKHDGLTRETDGFNGDKVAQAHFLFKQGLTVKEVATAIFMPEQTVKANFRAILNYVQEEDAA